MHASNARALSRVQRGSAVDARRLQAICDPQTSGGLLMAVPPEQASALCEDLQMRANMDCEWNMREQQSSVNNQQTWEINCRARRDSARRSFDNVCQPWRLQPDAAGDPR